MPNAPDPPGHEGVPELRRRRLLLPGRHGPHLELHEDEPPVRAPVSPDGRSITKLRDYDLTSVLEPDERISSALPDFRGRIWFVSKKNGKVAILNTKTRRIRAIRLGEDIQNSFTVDRRGDLRGLEQADVPLPGPQGQAARGVEGHLRQLRHREAGPGRRRLGHHADDHEGRLRRDHRQRRPDERRRLPQGRQAEAGAAAGGLPGAGVRPGRERHRELAHHQRPLALRGEQLRLPGPVRPEQRSAHHPGFARVDVNRKGRGCRKVWTNTPSARPQWSRSCPRGPA